MTRNSPNIFSEIIIENSIYCFRNCSIAMFITNRSIFSGHSPSHKMCHSRNDCSRVLLFRIFVIKFLVLDEEFIWMKDSIISKELIIIYLLLSTIRLHDIFPLFSLAKSTDKKVETPCARYDSTNQTNSYTQTYVRSQNPRRRFFKNIMLR